MERKRKRILQSLDSEADEDIHLVDPHEQIICMISEAHDKCTKDIKIEINMAMETKANELKSDIKDSREAERYVSMKHEHQAAMLRKLNKDIEDERSENKRLTDENVALQYSQGRHDAYDECVKMFAEVCSELKNLKTKIKTMDEKIKALDERR